MGFILSLHYLSRVKVPEHRGICHPPGGGRPNCPNCSDFCLMRSSPVLGATPFPLPVVPRPRQGRPFATVGPGEALLEAQKLRIIWDQSNMFVLVTRYLQRERGQEVGGRKIRASAKPEKQELCLKREPPALTGQLSHRAACPHQATHFRHASLPGIRTASVPRSEMDKGKRISLGPCKSAGQVHS